MDGTGIEYFRLSMGMNRFYLLLRAIRFDDITTRAMRQSVDNLAPIRSFFEDFVRRCQDYYELNNYVTIDEMLESFRGRCRFRQYIPNKPAKYGLKIIALVDSNTYYSYDLEIYAGKQPNGPYHVNNSACSVVERLIRPISGSGRNITCDNWFSSIPLAEDLLNNHNLTMVGTLRKNKREIPPIFVQKLKELPNESSIFGLKKNMTLVSYKPKANKIVSVISTMHNDDSIDTDCARSKPEMIKFYNSTKGGVDTVDQMKGKYSVSRNSRRWPLKIFFSVLNIAGINSQIIYASKISDSSVYKIVQKLRHKHNCTVEISVDSEENLVGLFIQDSMMQNIF
ncbi:piggyBac transposable element-derived protein 4-like [Aphis gossypii]|uniref:piggyBac transposable element-derived protein 4-like n=1 Tax=Aphis gossypii TaxID=80765 RepID=UPI0021591ECE|nr:piggyBac transposable element-derived protein 4-like [Aphis gossypii]